ncbi:MAG: hypothetical protein P8101_22570 [Candidatus Thiodiazotropha sp.]
MDPFEHKLFVLHLNDEHLSLQTMVPGTVDEHDELCRLEEKGLAKLLVIDSSSSFIFHKSFIQKIINTILSVDNPNLEIVDCSQNSRRILQIKASNIRVREVRLSSEKHEQLMCEGSVRSGAVKKHCFSLFGKLNIFKSPAISGANCKG